MSSANKFWEDKPTGYTMVELEEWAYAHDEALSKACLRRDNWERFGYRTDLYDVWVRPEAKPQ